MVFDPELYITLLAPPSTFDAVVQVVALPFSPPLAENDPVTVRLLILLFPLRVEPPAVNPLGKEPVPPAKLVAVITLTFVLPFESLPTTDAPDVQLLSTMCKPSSKSAFKLIHLEVDATTSGGTLVAVDWNWNE